MVTVIMGVSGCGKTTVGGLLAKIIGVPFYDADAFHPASNVARLAAGIPLNDGDRLPWLNDLAAQITQWEKQGGAVLACSALKESYRNILSGGAPGAVQFVYLKGTIGCIGERMKKRSGHYMPLRLLESQFAELEPPVNVLTVSIDGTPDRIASTIAKNLVA
jgi:gluconokinase